MFATSCANRLILSAIVWVSFVRMNELTDNTTPTHLLTSTDSLNLTVLNSSCWTNLDCNVAADLTRVHLDFTFLVILNCKQSDPTASNQRISSNQYNNIPKVALDGCSVNRVDTLGVEFVPDPSAVQALSIRMFRIVGDIPTNAFANYDHLEWLNLTDNIIDGVSNGSFTGLNTLKSLTLSNCDLQYLDNSSFAHLHQLQNLIIRENWLNISQRLELPDVIQLVLEVHTLDWSLRLPDSLEELSVINTKVIIPNGNIDALRGLSRLKTFNLIYTNVTDWPAIVHSNTLQMLNLSHNHLYKLVNHNLPTLHTYDVSSNVLQDISDSSVRLMPKLVYLHAQNNKLETISSNAFAHNANLQRIDLTNNQLRHMNLNLPAQHNVLIQVDDNEWSCRWADDFSTSNPQVFARFRYTKVLDHLNTRGLRCKFYEQTSLQNHIKKYQFDLANISTTTPILLRRNPKDTAVLTLIILVVGVAILFLMLFLHIKCRQDGLPQFNRFLPADGSMLNHQMAVRTDFVRRKLPPTEYEVPIVCLRSNPPVFDDIEKRNTDDGIVYEEIPDRKCQLSVPADQIDDSSPVDAAIPLPQICTKSICKTINSE